MNLRSGKLTNSEKPIPKRRYNKKMVNSTSGGGNQDPSQGSGTVAANTTNVSTSMPESQEIPTSTGSAAVSSSQAMPENTSGPTWTISVSSSTTVPPFTGTTKMPHFSTNFTSQL